MKPENRQFLDDNRHHHDTLIKAFYLRGLDGNTREAMQRVMREEFQPGYHTDLWCPPCVCEMVIQLYRRYDEWLTAQPPETPLIPEVEPTQNEAPVTPAAEPEQQLELVPEEVPKEGEPVIVEEEPAAQETPVLAPAPLQVAATFPSHKRKKHNRK